MTDRKPMFAIEARQIIAGKAERLWFRKLDNHWTHHNTRVQFYGKDEADEIVARLPDVEGRVVRVIPSSEVPA